MESSFDPPHSEASSSACPGASLTPDWKLSRSTSPRDVLRIRDAEARPAVLVTVKPGRPQTE